MTETPLDLKDWRFTVDAESIAWAVFDREGESVNSLGRNPIQEFTAIVEWMETHIDERGVRGLGILSGKPRSFVVGADIREFADLDTEEKVFEAMTPVLDMLDRLEALKVPVACGIHGPCLGGGLELALACDYRIATRLDATRIGFPEVKLGIFPGFHGTARSIRQAGPAAAMQSMLTGSMMRASLCRRIGYIDELVNSPLQLRWSVRKAILKKRKSRPAGWSKWIMGKAPIRSFVAQNIQTKTEAKVRQEHYPAPFALIELFRKYGGNYNKIKSAETRLFAPLMVGNASRNLRRVFHLSEQLKGQAPKNLGFKPLRVHVIGAGVMGADIAGFCVAAGMQVSLQDLSPEVIKKGIKAQDNLFRRRFKTKAELDAAHARLIADPEGDRVSRADVVIEAIVEKLDIKQKLFSELEPRLKPGAVLATNTSSIMIEDIAEPLKDPGRLVGIHFFNPVAQMPLVEIVKGAHSRDDEVQKGCAFVAAIGKFPLIVKSVPGFLVNRVLAPYMFDAFQRLEAGENIAEIDEAAKVFGMPMGPIELADTVGLDVCAHVGEVLKGGVEGTKLSEMVASGKLGKKSGQGFYRWHNGKPISGRVKLSQSKLEELGRELVQPLIDECIKCRDEGVVATSDLVDAGVIFGTGFAPFRGGPLHYIQSIGAPSEASDDQHMADAAA